MPTNLRPLSFGEILDGAFSLYRRNFSTFFLTALVPVLPVVALWALAGLFVPAGTVGAAVVSMIQVLAILYSLFASILVYAALTREAASAYQDEPISWREGLRVGLSRYPSVLGAALLACIAMSFGTMFFLVPGILIGIMFFAVVPVTVIEGKGVADALGRSKDLASGAWGRIFGVVFILYLIVMIPMMAAGLGSAFVGMSLAAAGGTATIGPATALLQVGNSIVTALTTPLLMSGVVVLYYDRRVRIEGLDIEQETALLEPIV
ncbi:MAG TPA: hypothetical protein VFL93_07945 [Longimicrobiaceae bacterium]|nr:hypothetical protein [Longimicrobiaceae bacterium]